MIGARYFVFPLRVPCITLKQAPKIHARLKKAYRVCSSCVPVVFAITDTSRYMYFYAHLLLLLVQEAQRSLGIRRVEYVVNNRAHPQIMHVSPGSELLTLAPLMQNVLRITTNLKGVRFVNEMLLTAWYQVHDVQRMAH